MSADLFAEFNSISSNSPSAQQRQSNPYQPPPPSQPQPQPQPQPQNTARDPFDFFQSSKAPAVASSPALAWPSFQQQAASTNDIWGTPTPFQSSSTTAQQFTEDDDGWGDFEVASPAVPAPVPAPVTAPVTAPAPAPAPAQPAASNLGPSFGSFGSPSNSSSLSIAWQNPSPAPAPRPAASPAPAPRPQPPRTRVIRASTLDLMSNNLVDVGIVSQQQTQPQWGQPAANAPASKARLKSAPSNPNVLFDAEDFELQGGEEDDDDDDEFGDFETVDPAAPPPKPAPVKPQVPSKAPSQLPSMDLLSLYDPPQSTTKPAPHKQPPTQLLGALSFSNAAATYPQAPKSPSFQDRNPFPDLAIKTPTGPKPKAKEDPKSATPTTAWPTFDDIIGSKPSDVQKNAKVDDDEWAAWDEFPPEEETQPTIESTKPPESWGWDAVDNVNLPKNDIRQDAPPPINVPPPSVVLSIFPDLLNSGNALLKPISGHNGTIKQRILADPKATEFLQGYILLAVTAARVIAGRKQRWHRDKILAKSMSISAAGSKGMKLAGVDKTQSAREDREAADVVAVWKQQVGRLRSAVAAANTTGKVSLTVPELSENMAIHTDKLAPTAPKACIICGLKREERVAKVDHDVEDSFGEWWADHWGHKACKNFWIEHEQKLRQR